MTEQTNSGVNPISAFAVVLSLLFAAGKVFGVGITQTWSWWAVLSPVLIWWGFGLALLLFVVLVAVAVGAVKAFKK